MTISNDHGKTRIAAMISICILMLVSVAISQSAGSRPVSENRKNTDYAACEIPAIQSVVITVNGAWDENGYAPDETPQMCKMFQVQEKDVRDYFSNARQVSDSDYNDPAVLYASRCYAEGRIQFTNGTHGRWRIDFERRGYLRLSDSRHCYYFCSACRSEIFYPWIVE